MILFDSEHGFGQVKNHSVSVKQFLDGEIEGKSWDEIRGQRLLTTLFENPGNLSNTQTRGVGEKTIKRFLGPILMKSLRSTETVERRRVKARP